MSDYRDVVRLAIEQGFYLDSCGEEERHYTWGSWIDLCGMDPEEANKASGGSGDDDGGDTSKTKNTITFVMQKGSNDEYTLYLNAEKAPTEDVVVSFTMDDTPQIVTLPAGTTSFNTGLKGSNPTKPYAVIKNTGVSSEDEQYTYKTKNSVKTGIFTLTVDNNGVKTTEQVPYGEPVTLPAVEDREGYDFKWTDASGTEITGSTYTMPEANATITGKYVAKSYTLTYVVKEEVLNGDTVSVETISSNTATLTYGTKIWNTIKNLTPAKTGYTLDGWKSSDGNVTSATTMPAKDLEVTNIYKLNKYTLTFKADGAEISSEQKYYGQAIAAPQIPDKTGYNTIGWDNEIPATMPASNKTFTAVYEAIIYYIRYSVDGDEKYVEEHIYGDAISVRADETKVGHTFSGWEPSTLPATMPAENIDVVGTFTRNNYTLTFMSDGSLYTEITGAYEDPVQSPGDPAKEGYTFTGWNPEVPATIPAENMTINAVFQINSYTLEYWVDNELDKSFSIEYNSEITPIAEPTKEGYTFSGWSEIPERMPAHNVRIDGAFSVNSYTLTYKVNDRVHATETHEYDSDITPLAEPTQEGYTFSGWSEIPAKMPARDVEVTGYFTVNTWHINYLVNNEPYLSEEHNFGDAIQVAQVPDERVGYTFSGWTYDEFPATMPDHDITVTGVFNVNQYTLTFMIGDDVYDTITADYDTDVTAPTASAKTGYTFSGWSPAVPAKMPAENMTFNGTYNINSWVATYYIDGVQHAAITYQYGATIDYPNVPKDGYTLKWTKEYVTMPDQDIDINGAYEEFQESKAVYYGMILTSEEGTFKDLDSLSTYDYENGVEHNVVFTIPASDEYIELEEKYNDDLITDEEWDAWLEANQQSFFLAIPASTTFVAKTAGIDVTSTFTAEGNPFTVDDGTEYQAYVKKANTSPSNDDINYNYILKINK